MPRKSLSHTEHIEYHKDGSIWARGSVNENGEPDGYWEWFRKPVGGKKAGTKMRSGYFQNGKQVGEWTTYDKDGAVYKVTKMKP